MSIKAPFGTQEFHRNQFNFTGKTQETRKNPTFQRELDFVMYNIDINSPLSTTTKALATEICMSMQID
jgi:hypothetical protein